ncbi:MAG: EpsI family protein, partial [Planctomycetales bacterium]|nr:EpsI family protein [Planctomycetales bacterium]
MNKRIGVLVFVLLVSYGSIGWLRSGIRSTVPPKGVDLSTVPLEIDGWSGEETEIRDDTVQVLAAQSHINRLYRNDMGQIIALHLADWANSDTIIAAPHHPQVCYPAAGWSVVERRAVEVESAAGTIPMELILFQKDQQRVVTAHWFQVGEVAFHSHDGFQSQRHRFWGTGAWPHTTKFLLQTGAASLDVGQEVLTGFAPSVAEAVATAEG